MKKLSSLFYLLVCFLLVIGTAKLFALLKNNFETSQRVKAEILPPLPDELKQNQIRYLIEEGYLTEIQEITNPVTK